MTLIKLNENQIAQIYQEELVFDFPQDEVKPLERLLQMLHDGIYFGYGLYENETLRGYAFFVESKKENAVLLDYYAVLRGQRSGGIGSQFLSLLQAELRNFDALLLESEAIDKAKNQEEASIRTRRIAFYLRNGVRKTGVRASVFGVEYEILCLDEQKTYSEQELRKALSDIYHQMFYPKYIDQATIF